MHFCVHKAGTGLLAAVMKWTSNWIWSPSSMFKGDNERTLFFSPPRSPLLNLNKTLCVGWLCWKPFNYTAFFFQQPGGLVMNQMNVFVSWKWFYMASNSWMSLTASKGVKAQLYIEHKWFNRCHVVLVYLYYPELTSSVLHGILIRQLLQRVCTWTIFWNA